MLPAPFRTLLRLLVAVPLALAWAAAPRPCAAAGLERLRYVEYPELEGRSVRQVLILGNNFTEPVVFRREMRTAEGDPFSATDLWHDWERLVDLGIFAELEVEAVPSGDGVLVIVSVYERPRWFVAPVADYDLDDGSLTYGYRLRLRNYDGMNRSFRSKGVFGKRDRVTATWATPWLGSRRVSLFLDGRVELPHPRDDELRTSRFGVGTTRFVGDYKIVRQGVSAFGRLEKLDRDGTHFDGPIDELSPVIGVGWFRDGRNVRIDPSRGSLLSSGTELVSTWSTNDVSYLRSFVDVRTFLGLGRGTVLAARATTTLSTGEVPRYRDLAVGGAGSIRGQRGDVERGKNVARVGVEWRFPLMPRRRFVLPIPLVPKRISNFDLRVDGELFVDAGTAWDDSVGFRSARIRPGAGFGLRIFLPVLELARIELAFDPSGSPRMYFREGNLI